MNATDALRVFAISASGGVVGLSLAVFYYYFIAWRRDKGHGLLPIHVILVVVYVIIQSVVNIGVIYIFLQDERPLNWIGPTIGLAQTVLIVGLAVVLKYEKLRYARVLLAHGQSVQDVP